MTGSEYIGVCGTCLHDIQDHIPQKDCVNCSPYSGECRLCSCEQWQGATPDRIQAVKSNIARNDADRETMTEFRITFGWNQPFGPGEGDPCGHYTTIWSPSIDEAYTMASVRYNNVYSMFYNPQEWRDWGSSMKHCKELEVLQFTRLNLLLPYPEKSFLWYSNILGRGSLY